VTQDVLPDFTPSAVIAAIEQSFISFTTAYVRMGQGHVHEDPEMTWVYAGDPLSYFNGVIRTSFATADPDPTIATVLAFFQARQQLMTWWISPLTRPQDLSHRLEAQGLTLAGQDTGMAVDLQRIDRTPTLPPGLEIERVRGEESMRQWLHTFGLLETANKLTRPGNSFRPPAHPSELHDGLHWSAPSHHKAIAKRAQNRAKAART